MTYRSQLGRLGRVLLGRSSGRGMESGHGAVFGEGLTKGAERMRQMQKHFLSDSGATCPTAPQLVPKAEGIPSAGVIGK